MTRKVIGYTETGEKLWTPNEPGHAVLYRGSLHGELVTGGPGSVERNRQKHRQGQARSEGGCGVTGHFRGYRWRKVTPEQARAMLNAYRNGVYVPDLAAEYGISPRTVYRVIDRAASDLDHCVLLCAGTNISVPSKKQRGLIRDYLAARRAA